VKATDGNRKKVRRNIWKCDIGHVISLGVFSCAWVFLSIACACQGQRSPHIWLKQQGKLR
jgi:hypothetical protein